jgi:TRAP-type C4-dicarboxylate transport system permease large subunit
MQRFGAHDVRGTRGRDPVRSGLAFIVAVRIGNFTPAVGFAMDAVCSILKCSIGADTESVPSLIAVSVVTPIFVPEVVLFVPDVIFAKDRR